MSEFGGLWHRKKSQHAPQTTKMNQLDDFGRSTEKKNNMHLYHMSEGNFGTPQ